MSVAQGAALQVERVTKAFGGFTAVDDLDLEVPSGSFFALLGPSGCGKTTTLRMVAGLEQPTAGSITIGGRDVTGTRAHQRPVNTVFQSYALFPHLTVGENVAFGLRRRRERDVDRRVAEALELVELGHVADRRPAQLSGGQQQRVALARAVVNRPALLLLDEPLGALDLKLRRQMQLELKRIQDEVGLTFVHVTHDQEEAMTMADTVAVMNHGRIEQLGAPADLYELPRTAFVANFLGQSNLAPGTVVEGPDGHGLLGVDVGGSRVRLPAARAVAAAGRVLVGVRPEKVRILVPGQEPGPGENVLGPGVVTDVSFAGVSTQYRVELTGVGTFGVFAQNLLGGATVAHGAVVRLAWSAQHTFGLSGDEDVAAGAADLDGEP
ncbi:ABC transporter ATP-binding protein [Cellulomonas marina]|uniref:Spermidine/putrescine transport system ATP-binding protein n=1 Tax=Cellulomonas marina TaxID=988821 RepID=A0A1I0VFZ6_9CELL|nr:ABC transporter ATP-binding protein [Cellulomonas marina]GIG27990.1 polyamine-transporting ATPase [Cellulomonas marina]SFA75231.1 spermidine/putrescine transport system ATP-binding protein [Cellulomonas marina]